MAPKVSFALPEEEGYHSEQPAPFTLHGSEGFNSRMDAILGALESHKRPFEVEPQDPFEVKKPDYLVHPEKWTKYSLEDVEMDENVEKQSALAFLQELRNRKNQEMNGKQEENSKVYQVETKKQFGLMEECVVGMKSPNKPRKKSNEIISNEISSKQNLKQSVILNHLFVEEEEIEENTEFIITDQQEENQIKFKSTGKKKNRNALKQRIEIEDEI